jgi:hypothetical protein
MNNLDINKIIDDAMEKKDRSVNIFIHGDNTSVYVEPLKKHDPRWIDRSSDGTGTTFSVGYECPECHMFSKFATPYCGICGEKLGAPNEEATDE